MARLEVFFAERTAMPKAMEFATEQDREVFDRVIASLHPTLGAMVDGESTILAMGKVLETSEQIASVARVREEIDFIHRNHIGFMAFGQEQQIPFVTALVHILAAHHKRIIDREGWYPAKYYQTEFGITSDQLRTAVKRKQLVNTKPQKTTLYPFAGVKRLWPELLTV